MVAPTLNGRTGRLRPRHWHSSDNQWTAAHVDQAYLLNSDSGLGSAGEAAPRTADAADYSSWPADEALPAPGRRPPN